MPKVHIKFSTVPVLLALSAFCGIRGTAAWLCAAALHESGHLLALHSQGNAARAITVTPLGILIEPRRMCRYREEWIMLAAGPLANLAGWLCSFALWPDFAAANAGCGLLNALPILSLDGGQALYALLAAHDGASGERSRRIARAVGAVTLGGLYLLAVYLLLYDGASPSLLALCIFLFHSMFLPGAACQKRRIQEKAGGFGKNSQPNPR